MPIITNVPFFQYIYLYAAINLPLPGIPVCMERAYTGAFCDKTVPIHLKAYTHIYFNRVIYQLQINKSLQTSFILHLYSTGKILTAMPIQNLIAYAFICLLTVTSAASAQQETYKLQPGDVISINVVEHPEYSARHKIRPDGNINYPVLGEIKVSSLSCAELAKMMEEKLTSYINNPMVSVAVEKYYANKIYIIGNVRNPGRFEIYEPVTILNALAMCGGLTKKNASLVKIIKKSGEMKDVNLKTSFTAQNSDLPMLYPGDTLYVPSPFSVPWGLIATIVSIISSSIMIVVNVNRL